MSYSTMMIDYSDQNMESTKGGILRLSDHEKTPVRRVVPTGTEATESAGARNKAKIIHHRRSIRLVSPKYR